MTSIYTASATLESCNPHVQRHTQNKSDNFNYQRFFSQSILLYFAGVDVFFFQRLKKYANNWLPRLDYRPVPTNTCLIILPRNFNPVHNQI